MALSKLHHLVSLPSEALVFLAAVAGCLMILIIFFLYLNKAMCFSRCGGFPCVDAPPKKKDKSSKLGVAYAYDDETSSDSDDEVLQRFKDTMEATAIRRSSSQYSHKPDSSPGTRRSGSRASIGKASIGKMSLGSVTSPEKQSMKSSDSVTIDNETAKSHLSPKVEKLIDIDTKSDEEVAPRARSGSHSTVGSHHPQEAGAESAPTPSSVTTGSIHTLEGTQIYNNEAFDGVSPSESGHATDEHMFDVSDLQQETALISKCGSLEVTFDYDPRRSRMTVTVHQAIDIPAKERGGANNTQVRLLLLPTKKQRSKTRVKQGDSPSFEEKFVFKNLTEADVSGYGIRFRLYGTERMRRERMIGESIIGFASLNIQAPSTHWVILEPRSNLSGDSNADVASLSHSDSASSTQSLQHGGMPELLIGLSYNGTTGRLSVEVIKGSNFRNMAMNRAPDTYVKLTLMAPNGSEVAHSKTSVRRGQPNPLFKETFMFQVALFQLADVTLMVSVYNKKSMKKKEMIGWFALGHNSSGEEEGSHWTDMRESKGDNICRWHVLLES